MEHQDWTPIYAKAAKHLKSENKTPAQEPTDKPYTSHKERKLDDAVENGQLTVKKFDATFGKEVQKFRLSKGWKQQDFARKLNVNQKIINEIEAGKAKYSPALMSKMKRLMT